MFALEKDPSESKVSVFSNLDRNDIKRTKKHNMYFHSGPSGAVEDNWFSDHSMESLFQFQDMVHYSKWNNRKGSSKWICIIIIKNTDHAKCSVCIYATTSKEFYN